MNNLLKKPLIVVGFVILILYPLDLPGSDWEIFRKGANSSAFMLIGTDARTTALGGEGSGLLYTSAIYWNPANSLGQSRSVVQHEMGHYLLGMDHQISQVHLILQGNRAISASINNLDMGQEEITTVYNPQGTGQYYSAQSMTIALNYAQMLTDRIAVGVQSKWIREQIWLEQATNLAFDIGLRYYETQAGFALGMAIQNVGGLSQLDAGPRTTFTRYDDESNPGSVNSEAEYILKKFPLPLLFRMGLSKHYKFSSNGFFTPSILINAGFSDGLTTPFRTSAGIEIKPVKALALRSGYEVNRDLGSLSLGLGLDIPLGQSKRVIMDYAWVDMDYFGAVERYQLSLEF